MITTTDDDDDNNNNNNTERRFRFEPRHWCFPENTDALGKLVHGARANGTRIRVVGAGHSWSDVAVPDADATLVSLARMPDELLEVDRERMLVSVPAGMRIHDLVHALAARGLAMHNLGSIDAQAVAGAILTGTHGTGLAFGILATHVRGMELVTGRGEVLNVSAKHHADIFHAALVSMGAIGIVTRLTLHVEPLYNLHESQQLVRARRLAVPRAPDP